MRDVPQTECSTEKWAFPSPGGQRRPPTNVETGSEETGWLPGSDKSTRHRSLRHWSGTTGVLNGVRLLGPSGAVQAGVAWMLWTHYEMVLHVTVQSALWEAIEKAWTKE